MRRQASNFTFYTPPWDVTDYNVNFFTLFLKETTRVSGPNEKFSENCNPRLGEKNENEHIDIIQPLRGHEGRPAAHGGRLIRHVSVMDRSCLPVSSPWYPETFSSLPPSRHTNTQHNRKLRWSSINHALLITFPLCPSALDRFISFISSCYQWDVADLRSDVYTRIFKSANFFYFILLLSLLLLYYY